MPKKERLIPWDAIRVLMYSGMSLNSACKRLHVPISTVKDQIRKYHPDLNDLSKVAVAVFRRYGVDAPPSATIIQESEQSADLSWTQIEDYLAIGMTVKETAAACGIDPDGLEELYQSDRPADYDCVETWATVLRARRSYELLKAVEKRALDGDLRAAVVLGKMRYQRWPKDSIPPPNHMHEI